MEFARQKWNFKMESTNVGCIKFQGYLQFCIYWYLLLCVWKFVGESMLLFPKFLSSLVKNPVSWTSIVLFSNAGKVYYSGHWIY